MTVLRLRDKGRGRALRAAWTASEVAVDWTDDPDSRVEIVSTAVADVRGVARLALTSPVVRFVLVANTQANRHFTFRLRGRPGLLGQHAAGGLVYLIALGLTGGALDVLRGIDPHPSRLLEVTVLIVASAFATVSRYVALRTSVFARPAGVGRDPLPILLSDRRP